MPVAGREVSRLAFRSRWPDAGFIGASDGRRVTSSVSEVPYSVGGPLDAAEAIR